MSNNDNMMEEQTNSINIELSEADAEGTYANLAIISHSPAEFVIDFTRILPGITKAKVKSRIIMTPQHTKLLLLALGENIGKFEAQYGEITLDNRANPMFQGFGGGSSTIN